MLSAEVEGEIEKVNGTIAITRINVKYRVRVKKGEREKVERALEIHKDHCPVAVTLTRGVEFSFEAAIDETLE